MALKWIVNAVADYESLIFVLDELRKERYVGNPEGAVLIYVTIDLVGWIGARIARAVLKPP